MKTCAVCNISDNLVINVIVADPTDPPYEGTYFVEVTEDTKEASAAPVTLNTFALTAATKAEVAS